MTRGHGGNRLCCLHEVSGFWEIFRIAFNIMETVLIISEIYLIWSSEHEKIGLFSGYFVQNQREVAALIYVGSTITTNIFLQQNLCQTFVKEKPL